MAENDIILGVGAKVDESSFIRAGQEGSRLAQQGIKPLTITADFSKISQGIAAGKNSFNQLTESTRDFGDSLERGLSRITALGVASAALFGIVRAFESSLKASRDLEASLKDINVILGLPTDKLQAFGQELFNVARQTKTSFEQVSEATKEFSRQGLNAEETINRTRAALTLVNLAGLSAAEATRTITSAINSFSKENLSAIEIVNKLATVDAKFAVSSKDLAEALTRVGSVAQESGVGFDKLISLVTGAQQVTQRGGSVIANALNTIFTRLKREDTLDALENLGIQVREVESSTGKLTGTLVPADKILTQLAERFKTLTQEQKANVSEIVAGVRQGNVLTGILQGLGVAQEAYTTSVNASDEALKRQSALLTTQEAKLKNLGTSLQQLGANVGKVGFGDFISKQLEGLNTGKGGNIGANIGGDVIKAFSGTLEGDAGKVGNEFANVFVKSISDILLGPGLVAFGLIGAKIGSVLGGFVGKQFSQVNPFSEQATTQTQIDKLLTSQSQKITEILTSENNKVSVEQKILALFRQQNEALVQQDLLKARALEVLGSPAVRSIVGSNPIRNAANGLVDAVGREQAAISQGVGGAPSGAKPVVIPDFNGGTAVANSSEYLVPNHAGTGKDAIYNVKMAKERGLPVNAVALDKLSQSDVLKKTSAPIGKLLSSGKFTEEQLLKFLEIPHLSSGHIFNYADYNTPREVGLGSTFTIPLQSAHYPSQIVTAKGQAKRISEKLLSQGLSREEVTDFFKNFRAGRSSALPFQEGKGKTPFLLQDEQFKDRRFLNLYVTPKDILPHVNAADGYIHNYAATDHPLKLTRTGIIQRQLPTGELVRPSEDFLKEAYQHYHRTEIEGILRTFEKSGEFLTENKFLNLTRQNQKTFPVRPASSFASGHVPNLASGDEALSFIQNKIRELSSGAQKLLENNAPFGTNQLAVIPPQSRPSIPSVNFNIPKSLSQAPEQKLLSASQPLLLENNVNAAAIRFNAAKSRSTQLASTGGVIEGISSSQTNSFNSPQLFSGSEQDRLQAQAVNQRNTLPKIPKTLTLQEGANLEGSLRDVQNAHFKTSIDQVVKSLDVFDKDLVQNSKVFQGLEAEGEKIRASFKAGELDNQQYHAAITKLQTALSQEVAVVEDANIARKQIRGGADFNKVSQSSLTTDRQRQTLGNISKLDVNDIKGNALLEEVIRENREATGRASRLAVLNEKIESNTNPFGVGSIGAKFERFTLTKLPQISEQTKQSISSKTGTAAFVIPFAGEALASPFLNKIQDPIERNRAGRGVSTALGGLSTAATIASVAPNPIGLGIAGAFAVGSLAKAGIEGTTVTDEDRAQKLDNFVKELGEQRDTIATASKAVFDFRSALEDTTISEKQRLSFQREALAATRNISDPAVARSLRQQVLNRDFSGKANDSSGEAIQNSLNGQQRQTTLNADNVALIFGKVFEETKNKTNFLGLKTEGPEGISSSTSKGLSSIIEAQISQGKTPEEQTNITKELLSNSNRSLDTIQNILRVTNVETGGGGLNNSPNFGKDLANAIQKALPEGAKTTENLLKIKDIREGKDFSNVNSFQSIIQENVKTLSNRKKDDEDAQKAFTKNINLTSLAIQNLGKFALRDIEESGIKDIGRNQRLIGQQGDIQNDKNSGIGAGEIQLKEFANSVINSNEDAQRQQFEVSKQLSSQLISSILTGTKAQTVAGALDRHSDTNISKFEQELGNVSNVDDFTKQIDKLKSALSADGTNDSQKLILEIEKLGQSALEASKKIGIANAVEQSKINATREQTFITNRLNPNKTEQVAGTQQLIGQSKFLNGLAPTTTDEIAQASKERLAVLNKTLGEAAAVGAEIPKDLKELQEELTKKVRLSDIDQAGNKLSDNGSGIFPGAISLRGLQRDILDKSREQVENPNKPATFEGQVRSIAGIKTGLLSDVDISSIRRQFDEASKRGQPTAQDLQNVLRNPNGGSVKAIENNVDLKEIIAKNIDAIEKLNDASSANKPSGSSGNDIKELQSVVNDLKSSLDKGITLNYGGAPLPVNGEISLTLNSDQLNALSKSILDSITEDFNGKVQQIQGSLDSVKDNLKVVNKATNTAIPPKAP